TISVFQVVFSQRMMAFLQYKNVGDELDTIRMTVRNMRMVSLSGELSPVTRINGFPWRLRFIPSSNWSECKIALICDKSTESELWACKSAFIIKIICGAVLHIKRLEHSFNCWGNEERGMEEFVRIRSNFDAKEEPVTVEVEISTDANGEKFTRKQQLKWFLPTDIVLVIGEEKIHVNKKALAAQSDYFNALFFGDFKEKNQEEIELKDIDPEEFTLVLKMMYIDEPVNDSNAEIILKIADQFGFKILSDKTEKFLMCSSTLREHTKLRLSDQYNLRFLQEFLLPHYKSVYLVHELKKSVDYKFISDEMKVKLFEGI
ncbi:hypothetical protein PFISCL1PPCAC_12221, partial [Pristionchus fissidentatus]